VLRRLAVLFVVFAGISIQAAAVPFVVFPKAGRLVSPDGRYEVRDADRTGAPTDFIGTFHSLWLVEVATGRSRKLCDYLGISAVAWSGNDFLVVTQYVGKKTSRALMFAISAPEEPVILDRSTLIQLVAPEMREHLRGNDHVFVEASSLESDIFYFGVWGYGQQDPNGFRWTCQFHLRESKLSCRLGK
jgi:hypothetical protein